MLKKIDILKGHFFSIERTAAGKFEVKVRDKDETGYYEDGQQWDNAIEAYQDALNRLDDFAFEVAFPRAENVEKSDTKDCPIKDCCLENAHGGPHQWEDELGNTQSWQ